jgi:hypothetical protein
MTEISPCIRLSFILFNFEYHFALLIHEFLAVAQFFLIHVQITLRV